jgi:hypothetical protein
MQTIKLQLDTNIIQDNTGDASPIQIIKETPVDKEITIGDQTIKGDNLVVTSTTQIYLGKVKDRQTEIDQRLADINAEIDSLNTEKVANQDLIDSIQPEVDAQLDEAVNNGATDERTEIAKPPVLKNPTDNPIDINP